MFHYIQFSIGRCVVVLALGAWMALTVTGFLILEAHEATPGAGDRSPGGWPGGGILGFETGIPNVAMAVHPRCPCTRASLEGLAEIVRRSADFASVRLLVCRPEGATEGWAGTSCSPAMAEIRGAIPVDDPAGLEAARFGLVTSAAVAAFAARGRPRFSGGLTGGGGRSGRSAGGEVLLAILEGRAPGVGSSPDFGGGLSRTSRRPVPRRAIP